MNIRFILLSLIISKVASLATDLDQFGTKLFSTLSQQNNGQNIFLSPASISLAISMCTVGARHETLQQMLHVLQVSSIQQLTNITEQIMQVFPPTQPDQVSVENLTTEQPTDLDASTKILMQPEFHLFVEDRSPVELRLANRLYAEKQFHIQQQYLDLIQKSFQSDIKLEDFEHESAKAVETINEWVEKQTNQRIRDILSTKDVTKDTRLVLINCIYFKSQWVDKFKERDTNKNANFYRSNGVVSKVELMFQKNYFDYAENKDLHIQIIHLPYISSKENEKFVFTVVLPNEGVLLDDVEQKLNSNLQLRQQLLSNENAASTDILLYLPKFKLETRYELQDTLYEMGMEDAFSDTKADFEGIVGEVTDKNRIRISKVIHKTFLNVNEAGTEAAAATVIDMVRVQSILAPKPKPIEFKADRPFLFFIREVEQDLILFSGKLVTP